MSVMGMDSIIQRRLPYSKGGRFGSECPADLKRNRWPICVGIRIIDRKTAQKIHDAVKGRIAEEKWIGVQEKNWVYKNHPSYLYRPRNPERESQS